MNPEIIGIVATTIVLVSFLAKKPKHIRLINAFGAVLFIIYGYAIRAVSVYLLNGALVFIHIIYLIDIMKREETS